MVKLMFGQTIVKWGFINKGNRVFKFGSESHFLSQAAFAGFYIGFPLPLVTTTSVGPQARRMIFCMRPLLEHKLVFLIENKHRECPVQQCFLMSFHFRHKTYLLIFFIY